VLGDLAAKAGVSKQAASKWLRRRGLGRSPTAPSTGLGGATATPLRAGAAGAPAPPPGAPAAALAQHAALAGLGQDQAALKSLAAGALIALLARGNMTLAAPGELGPSALKAIGVAVIGALEGLHRLGAIILDGDDAKKPTELLVRMMTPEETAALLAAHEADDQVIEAEQDDQTDQDAHPPASPAPPIQVDIVREAQSRSSSPEGAKPGPWSKT
jgi:hypothetical protein